MLTYCLKVCLELLQHRQFRGVVLRCLVELYRGLTTPDYVSMCQCLIFLDDPLAVADILDKLVHGDQDSTLMAFQIAFDLYESATQQFLARVLQALKPTASVAARKFFSNMKLTSFFLHLISFVLYFQLPQLLLKVKPKSKLRSRPNRLLHLARKKRWSRNVWTAW